VFKVLFDNKMPAQAPVLLPVRKTER